MKRELEVKQQVLDMLKDFLMSSDGGKFKPKVVEVEVITPMDEEGEDEGLASVLKNASKDADEECGPMDKEDEDKPKKKSLKDFFDR